MSRQSKGKYIGRDFWCGLLLSFTRAKASGVVGYLQYLNFPSRVEILCSRLKETSEDQTLKASQIVDRRSLSLPYCLLCNLRKLKYRQTIYKDGKKSSLTFKYYSHRPIVKVFRIEISTLTIGQRLFSLIWVRL